MIVGDIKPSLGNYLSHSNAQVNNVRGKLVYFECYMAGLQDVLKYIYLYIKYTYIYFSMFEKHLAYLKLSGKMVSKEESRNRNIVSVNKRKAECSGNGSWWLI